ncbi:disulfide bond formation protein B [Kingella negevensis]|uniref:Disulfide bond formation protein B n=1 Tax=Kingella negevensis TaxID=1522312 RepID=A0A238HGQ1_9NEIS|nr:disulfide bond formation protein B [Kingella negevensis]MDK4679586.1 disulfide bond formation protein B [Kingella negevensis]MDK4682696.1 disulfide bond formation protein B [Kingella negevensis]MDK4685261.1 disulfide bond formation protein B [Kingella negevensis]MDK4690893.1 disulfide bond formation protein B [Kingella negevensis]MDK4693960.1 disulfide bond formation protein B [Kingella negevensis]
MLQKLLALPRYRLTVLATVIMGFGGTMVSLFAQYVLKMNPCVMCIEQRMSLFFIGVLSLICLPLPLRKRGGQTAAALILSVPTVFGGFVAAKQIWLQTLPLREQPDCGAPWTFVLRGKPLFDLYEPLIRGSGMCGEKYFMFGISLPTWGLITFCTIFAVIWGMWWHVRRK